MEQDEFLVPLLAAGVAATAALLDWRAGLVIALACFAGFVYLLFRVVYSVPQVVG